MKNPAGRLTLGAKFVLFYLALLLLSLGNVWTVHEVLQALRGTAAMADAAHDMHRAMERVQLEVARMADGRVPDRTALEASLARFDGSLAGLTAAGGAFAGASAPGTENIAALRAAILSDRNALRNAADEAFDGRTTERDATDAGPPAQESATRIVNRIEAAIDTFRAERGEIEAAALNQFSALAFADFSLLVCGFLGVHFRIVRPLRRLHHAVRDIAAGRYRERVDLRLRDEIGSLAQAFNRMAEEVDHAMQQKEEGLVRLERAYRDVAKFFQAVEQSPVSVIITDAEGAIEYVNPRFTEASGYSRDEAIGRKTSLVRSWSTPREVHDELWQTILSGQVWRGELMNCRKNGECYWESVHIAPLLDDDGRITHFIAMKEDITAGKQAAEALARTSADLEQRVAERTEDLRLANAELESFSYSVAHDLRAPLRSISGYAALMSGACAGCGNPQGHEFLQRIRRASARMGELTDNLLKLAVIPRQRPAQAQAVDASAMAGEIAAGLQAGNPERRVAFTLEEGIRLNGDPGLLRILLENLLGNAWKYTAKREAATISVTSEVAGNERVVSVRDNGVGFDMSDASRMFTPFCRLAEAGEYEGSGIGLAIAQRIVALHGGRIWAEGRPGEGAVFHFAIPETLEGATT